MRLGPFSEGKKEHCVSKPDVVCIVVTFESIFRVLADDLQQAVNSIGTAAATDQKALVHQRSKYIEKFYTLAGCRFDVRLFVRQTAHPI